MQDRTRTVADPSDSMLATLTRAATAAAGSGQPHWPQLDLDDPAQRTFGDYDLLEEIGRGGMGVVYRAHQRSLDREVAIKFIATGIADSFSVARFLGEARAAARLMHPHIVPVHEVDSIEGLHYFSMPLVRGRSLADLLDAGVMPPATAVPLLLKLCDAIDYAHRLGLLHLDLKPANVLLDERSEPLVADFGLARHMDGAGGVDAQEVSGTPAYMAPEQVLIRQYRLTPATDVYALGAILYRCLTGTSPHGEGRADEVIRRAAAGRIRPPREVAPSLPRDLDAICMKCLELQPSDRYPSVDALADDLRRVRDGLPVSVRRVGLLERAQRWFRREPKLALASMFAVLALVSGVAATTWQWRAASAQRDAAVAQRHAAELARREADLQRQRAEGTAALGAWLSIHGEEYGSALNAKMLDWLRARFPRSDEQAAVTLSFAKALAEQGSRTVGFVWSSAESVMNTDYLQKAIAAWSASDAPRHGRNAALLAYTLDKQDGETPKQFAVLLEKAIADSPTDPMLWTMAATFCKTQCDYPQATQKMIELEPDNAFAWLLLVESTGDEALARRHLREAARRTRFDDHDGAFYLALLEGYRDSGVPLPPLVTALSETIWPDRTSAEALSEELSAVMAYMTGLTNPLPTWTTLNNRCDPAYRFFRDDSAYDDCRTVGLMMARSRTGMLAVETGADIARRLSKGTPLEREMVEVRRLQSYILDAEGKAEPYKTAISGLPMGAKAFFDEWRKGGEMHARSRQLERYGISGHPPEGWQPDKPTSLMLPEDEAHHQQIQVATKPVR